MIAPPISAATMTRDERLLVEAAFAPGTNGIDAWRAWRASREIDDVTTAEQRLFPRVYSNLGADVVDARVQGIHRRAWYANRLLLHAALPALAALREAGLQCAVVRESAIVLVDPAGYPLDRLHATVDAHSLDDALRVLVGLGWTRATAANLRPSTLRWMDITDADGRTLSLVCRSTRADRFWESTQHAVFEGHSTPVAGRAHQLLDVAVSLFTGPPEPTFLRVARCAAILRSAPFEQWELLAEIAARQRCSLALLELLLAAADLLGEPIAPTCFDALRSSATPRERRELRYLLDPAAPARRPMLLWADYHRAVEEEESLGFVEYLQRRWNVDGARQLVAHALRATLRRNTSDQPQHRRTAPRAG